jgi:hypothetical protein
MQQLQQQLVLSLPGMRKVALQPMLLYLSQPMLVAMLLFRVALLPTVLLGLMVRHFYQMDHPFIGQHK